MVILTLLDENECSHGLTSRIRIGITLGKFDEIRNDLTTISQKRMQWFLKPKVGDEGVPSGAIGTS